MAEAAEQQQQQQPNTAAGDQLPEFHAESTHGGRFIKYNVDGQLLEVTPKYRPSIKPIGRGYPGFVCSMLNTETNETVNIKRMANACDSYMDAKSTLGEIKILKHFDHCNITGIRDVIPPPLRTGFTDVYIATEHMDTDLHLVIRSNQPLSDDHFQFFVYQILCGLKYIHSANVIHRDLKPSNILLSANCDLKICNFGRAWPTSDYVHKTDYFANRWYTAPEVYFDGYDCTSAMDVWSLGCIFMELINRKPLFPGSNFVDLLRLWSELLGTPTEFDFPKLQTESARKFIREMTPILRQPLGSIYPNINPLAIDLVEKMLTYDPTRRITVEESLSHPYLTRMHDIEDEPTCPEIFSFDFEQQDLREGDIKEMIYKETLTFNPGFL